MKIRLLFIFIFITFSQLALAIAWQEYTVVKTTPVYEVRLYPPMLVAQTKVYGSFSGAGPLGFRILLDYLFGNNYVSQPNVKKSERIELIVPLMMEKTAGGYWLQFALPRDYSLDTVPQPNDARVKFKQFPMRKMAVIRYSGFWSEENYQEHLQKLTTALEQHGLGITGEPIFARYNSALRPPFWRRNEIWVEIVVPTEHKNKK